MGGSYKKLEMPVLMVYKGFMQINSFVNHQDIGGISSEQDATTKTATRQGKNRAKTSAPRLARTGRPHVLGEEHPL